MGRVFGVLVVIVLLYACQNVQSQNLILTASCVNATVGKEFSFTCEGTTAFVLFKGGHRALTQTSEFCTITGIASNSSCILTTCDTINYSYACENGNKFKYKVMLRKEFVQEDLHKTLWQCSNIFDGGIKSNEIVLNVNVPITKTIITTYPIDKDDTVAIAIGSTQQFICSTDAGRPSSRIQWYLSENNLTSSGTTQPDVCINSCAVDKIISSSILTLTGEMKYDGKQIFCSAVNINGMEAVKSQNKTIVIWYGPDQVNLNPSTQSYTVNETLSVAPITCTADCKPACTMSWRRQNVALRASSVLNLSNIDRNDAGNYTCLASNNVSSSVSVTVRIQVNYGPRQANITPSSQSHIVNEYDSIGPINCSADCMPACTVTWTGPNIPNSSSPFLSLKSIYRNQDGLYQCTASNFLSTTKSVNVRINVNYGPTEIGIVPLTRSYTVNETGSLGPLSCTADCKPNCTRAWKRQNIPVGNTSILILQNINRNQNGSYNCIATNQVATSTSDTVSVIVNYGPRQAYISPSYQSHTVNEYDSIGPINCSADCMPACTITWTGPNIPDSTSPFLSLENINRNKDGFYQCTASNFLSTTKSVNVRINVNYGPTGIGIVPSTRSYTVNETGSLGPISCTADCKPKCTMVWKRQNVPVWNTFILNLQNISRNQNGSYNCIATNEVANSTSDTVSVIVNYIPHVVYLFGNGTVRETETVSILCIYDSVPVPDIIWKFNNVPLKDVHIAQNSTVLSSSLVLQQIKCLSMGNYTCEANNIVGKDSKDFQVKVLCSPRLYAQENTSNVTIIPIKEDEPINITAQIIAFPQPDIQWKFVTDNTTVNISTEYVINKFNGNTVLSNLFMLNVSESDFGYYHLYAYNNIGFESGYIHSYNVLSIGKPNKPENVSCRGNPDSVEVYWQPGFNGGDEQLFRIQFKSFEDEKFVPHDIVYNESENYYMTAVIKPLHPDTRYSFRVLSSNKYNYTVSKTVYCNTSESVSSAQQNDNLTAIGIGTGIGMALIVIIIVVIYARRCKSDKGLGLRRKQQRTSSSKTYTDMCFHNEEFAEAYASLSNRNYENDTTQNGSDQDCISFENYEDVFKTDTDKKGNVNQTTQKPINVTTNKKKKGEERIYANLYI